MRVTVVIAAATSLVLGMGCVEEDDTSDPADAGADAGSRDTRDAGFDANPGCHWDCFGRHYCDGGVVVTTVHEPIPCSRWTGSCPRSASYHCEEGCRTDDVTEVYVDEEPVLMCEEGRPKEAGEPCTSPEDCQPPTSTGRSEDVDRMHLACDTDAGTCVPIADPDPDDWRAPCAVDVSEYEDPSDEWYRQGVIRDDGCSRGICRYKETPDCVVAECSMPCEHDWECPDGAWCRALTDHGPSDGGVIGHTSVCVPSIELPCSSP